MELKILKEAQNFMLLSTTLFIFSSKVSFSSSLIEDDDKVSIIGGGGGVFFNTIFNSSTSLTCFQFSNPSAQTKVSGLVQLFLICQS